ncbi:hypothetical protein GOODEAATRI_011423, partial [Goodea atripinnis]
MCCPTPATTAPYTLLREETPSRDLLKHITQFKLVAWHTRQPLCLFSVLLRPADSETSAPVADNQLICDQCFCYICDKLASSVRADVDLENHLRSVLGTCHCNSHNKSDFWTSIRNSSLLGELQRFNFTLSEVDCHLRNADAMLQTFRRELSALFSSITLSQPLLPDYSMNQQDLGSRYGPVFEWVTSFLNKADKQNSRAATIMHLGAAEELMRHFQVLGFMGSSSTDTTSETIIMLLHRYREVCRYLRVVLTDNPKL